VVGEDRPDSPPLPPVEEIKVQTGPDATLPDSGLGAVEKKEEVMEKKEDVQEKKPPTGPSASVSTSVPTSVSGSGGITTNPSPNPVALAYARRAPRQSQGTDETPPRGPSGWRDIVLGDKRRSRSRSPSGRGEGKRFKGDDIRGGRSPPRMGGGGNDRSRSGSALVSVLDWRVWRHCFPPDCRRCLIGCAGEDS
jgi:hypothetical protein